MGLPELMTTRREQMSFYTEGTGEVNIYDETSIDINDLSTEFIALPGQIAYWNMIAAKYTNVVSKLESEYDAWYALVYDAAFKELERTTGKRPNISSADYIVKKDHRQEWEEKNLELTQAKTDLAILAGIVPALNAKLSCLMQLAKARNVEVGNLEPVYRSPTQPTKTNKKESLPSVNEVKDLFKSKTKK